MPSQCIQGVLQQKLAGCKLQWSTFHEALVFLLNTDSYWHASLLWANAEETLQVAWYYLILSACCVSWTLNDLNLQFYLIHSDSFWFNPTCSYSTKGTCQILGSWIMLDLHVCSSCCFSLCNSTSISFRARKWTIDCNSKMWRGG